MSEFDPELFRQDDEAETAAQQGFLLSGEALHGVTLEEIRAKLGELGLEPAIEVTPVADVSVFEGGAEEGEGKPEPVPVTKRELIDFAIARGQSETLAKTAWNSLAHAETHGAYWGFPAVRFMERTEKFGPIDSRPVDLRSVYHRLWATGVDQENWFRAGPKTLNLLAQLCNERLQPEEPLPPAVEPKRRRRS